MSTRAVVGRGIGVLSAVILGNLPVIAPAAAQNVAPVISGSPATNVIVGQRYDFRPTVTDANGDALSFRAYGLPRWARFERHTGRVYGTPGRRDTGTSRRITISVSDGQSSSSLPGFTVQVVTSAQVANEPPANSAPSIGGTPAGKVIEQELYGFLPAASDPDGDPLSFSIANKPAWATFTSSSGLLSGIPPAGSAGTYSGVQISVSDGRTSTSLAPFSITVEGAPNRPPTISGTPATSIRTGQSYSFRPNASDPDGQTLRFSVMNPPAWASFDVATGELAGIPGATQVGTYSNVVVSATDGQATATLAPFAITVTAANTAPTAPVATVAAVRNLRRLRSTSWVLITSSLITGSPLALSACHGRRGAVRLSGKRRIIHTGLRADGRRTVAEEPSQDARHPACGHPASRKP